jgi:hypothetical protein
LPHVVNLSSANVRRIVSAPATGVYISEDGVDDHKDTCTLVKRLLVMSGWKPSASRSLAIRVPVFHINAAESVADITGWTFFQPHKPLRNETN